MISRVASIPGREGMEISRHHHVHLQAFEQFQQFEAISHLSHHLLVRVRLQ